MTAAAETFSLGMPAEIGTIDRELKKLWAETSDSTTRASLINLAIYSEQPDSLAHNTQMMSEITADHACRAIVIGADPKAKEDRAEAWVSAHCHVGREGSKQICSEQLSFRLNGRAAGMLPSIVFSHLDSDLPLYLWWQHDFPALLDPHLWSWIDRLIYDSRWWKDFDTQMRRVEAAQRESDARAVLCDLNWTRLDKIRLALAQFFDHPASHHHFAEISEVEIEHGPGFRSTALLLAGWLAAQLNWESASSVAAGALKFTNAKKRNIDVLLREKSGEGVSRFVLRSGDIEFTIAQLKTVDLLEVSRGNRGEKHSCQLLPAGGQDAVSLMREELSRGGPHRIYLRALGRVRELL